jgi:HNH endonuclease
MAKGTRKKAHRVSFILSGGNLPDGMCVDHVCRNRRCANPHHLRAVTPRANALENSVSLPAMHAAKTHCSNGHPFAGSNLGFTKQGTRICKECRLNDRRLPDGRLKRQDWDGTRLCKNHHRLTPDNVRKDERGYVRCLTCLRAKWAKRDVTLRTRNTPQAAA